MAIKSLMKMSIAPLVLVFAQAVSAAPVPTDPVTTSDVSQISLLCRDVDTREDAAACLEAFRGAAAQQTRHIVEALQSEGISTGAIRPDFAEDCLDEDILPFVESGVSPEEYLREAQFCLTEAATKAEEHDVSFEENGTSHLLARLRRLRHLDL